MRFLYSLFILSQCLLVCAADTVEPKLLQAPQTPALRIDGHIEPAWFTAGVADSFVQRNPDEGAQPSFPTRVYSCYDKDALYFAFVCLDSSPDSIAGRIMRRDNDQQSDFVDIYLDTFHDRRNCYWFTLTAAGVQSEGTIANENSYDNAWDAIWESAVVRTDSSWNAEVRIPFASFRHGGAREDGWGVNFARVIHRRSEGSFWQPVNRQRGFRVSEMGVLKGLRDISTGAHLEALPHAVGRWDAAALNDAGDASGKWKSGNEWENIGLYIKAVPSGSVTMDLAYQPDFAQVDVDQEVINLSDYPVFLQEKRPFFIEAKELFDTAPITMLYTRRIADPDYGGRLNGQVAAGKFSILGGKNRSEYGTLQDAAAGRMQWNIGKRNDAGTTVTYLQEKGHHANTIEQDARVRWGKDNSLQIAFAAVERSGLDKQPVISSLSNRMNFGILRWQAGLIYSGTDFNISDLGFQRYSNRSEQWTWVGNEYYSKKGPFESNGFDLNLNHQTTVDGKNDSYSGSLSCYNKLRNQWWFGGGIEGGQNVRRRYADDDESADYRDNFGRFNPEEHAYNWKWFWFDSDSRKPIELHHSLGRGTFREGKELDLFQSVVWKPRANLESTVAINWSGLRGVSDFNNYDPTEYRIWRWTLRFSPTLTTSFRGTIQWLHDNDGDISDELLTNLLYAWNWRPGSWFYVVYDEGGRTTDPLALKKPGDRTLRLKWTYFFTVG